MKNRPVPMFESMKMLESPAIESMLENLENLQMEKEAKEQIVIKIE